MQISKMHLAILAVILANIIWGAGAPIFKWSLHGIDPFTLSFIRFTGAALLILPLTIQNLQVKRKHWLHLIFMAFYGFVVNISLMLVGLQYGDSINLSIIGSSAPIFLIIGSFFFLKEIPKKKIVVGTLISLIGVLVIVFRPTETSSFNLNLWGNILFLISTLGIVIYTVLLKEIVAEYKPLTLTFWTFLIAGIYILPFTLIESHGGNFLAGIDLQGWLGALYGVIGSSVIAYVSYTYALKYIQANEIGVFLYVDPIATIAVAIPLIHEQITVPFLIGSLFVFLGIFIAEGRLNYHPLHRLLTVFIP